MAHVGINRACFEGLRLTWADSGVGRGATGTAIRTGQPSLGRKLLDDPDLAPWCDEALRRGFAAISVFPLRVDGEVIGNLSIAASEPDAFDAAEADLLGELADDLASAASRWSSPARCSLPCLGPLPPALALRAHAHFAAGTG